MNQVVGDFLQPVQARAEAAGFLHVPRDVSLAVLPDHQRGRHRGIVLRRHVDPVVGLHAAVELARMDELLGDAALRHTRPRVRVGRIGGHVVGAAELRAVDQVVEAMRRFPREAAPT